MRLTALDIREQQFRRIMRGFDPDEVVTFLGTVASEYEQLVAENRDIRQRLLDLEHQIAEFQSMEKALRDTLLTAERVTAETRENAQKEAGLILREAEIAAQQATSGISAEILQKRRELTELQQKKKDYLFGLRALAQSHLQMIDSVSQSIDREASYAAAPTSTLMPKTAIEPSVQADSAVEHTVSYPLPTEVGGVIPSAVAYSSAANGASPEVVAAVPPVAAPVAEPRVEASGRPGPGLDSSRGGATGSAWAEASFEPGDLVPRGVVKELVSAREAEHYRRGIASGDPLPSLLRGAGGDGNPAVDNEAPAREAWDLTSVSEAAHGVVDHDPAHAVRPDGTQGD